MHNDWVAKAYHDN